MRLTRRLQRLLLLSSLTVIGLTALLYDHILTVSYLHTISIFEVLLTITSLISRYLLSTTDDRTISEDE